MPELSVVVCTLNEAASIGGLIDEIGAAFAGRSYEIIVVDDDLKDGTQEAVEQKARTGARVRLIVRRGRKGLASAAIEGWAASKAERLAIMDGDGQHDPKVLRELDDDVKAGRADLAVMSRYKNGGASGLGRRRAAMSRLATWLTSLVLRTKLTDPMSGMFVMTRELFEQARPRLAGVGFKILIDLVASLKKPPRIEEVQAALRQRAGGVSKLDIRVIIDLAGLLTEKVSRGIIPARFVPFALVGATGIVLHGSVLALTLKEGRLPFAWAQATAIIVAMAWNYWLNNSLTFRDRRRRGWAFVTGAALFGLACASGAIVSELVSTWADSSGAHWLAAGLFGAVLGGVWNYVAASFITWRKPKVDAAPIGSVEEVAISRPSLTPASRIAS